MALTVVGEDVGTASVAVKRSTAPASPRVSASLAWANNPIGVAAIEAIGMLSWPRDKLKILSIGTSTGPDGCRD
jgi:hypothetical protein